VQPQTSRRAPAGGRRTAQVAEIRHPHPMAVVLRLEVPDRVDHLPGQHYVVRLTAPDGYVAQRSYSVVSAPNDPLVELFVERLDQGEVSSFLADGVEVGDELEIRGPIGGWFVWPGDEPALCVGGGTGVVPFVAMLRHAQHVDRLDLLRIAVAARTRMALPYIDEFLAADATVALSRESGPDGRPAGRLSTQDLRPLLRPGAGAFVCGSTDFAESASALLVDLGVPAAVIRVERFGPSG
jgi:ferredoxin-NADP reductase